MPAKNVFERLIVYTQRINQEVNIFYIVYSLVNSQIPLYTCGYLVKLTLY